jgi:hypothetical protein
MIPSLLVGRDAALLETGTVHVVLVFQKPSNDLHSMEAALAEMALDTSQKEMDDDVDFINGKGLCHQLRG